MRSHENENDSPNADCVSMQIVEQLAAAEGTDPRNLPSLLHTIDLETLDLLIESASSEIIVSFEVNGYSIVVTGDGIVELNSSMRS